MSLRSCELATTARTFPANGDAHTSSMVHVAPSLPRSLEESWAGAIVSAVEVRCDRQPCSLIQQVAHAGTIGS